MFVRSNTHRRMEVLTTTTTEQDKHTHDGDTAPVQCTPIITLGSVCGTVTRLARTDDHVSAVGPGKGQDDDVSAVGPTPRVF